MVIPWLEHALDLLKTIEKRQYAGGRDRTPDLQPWNALMAYVATTEARCCLLIIIQIIYYIKKTNQMPAQIKKTRVIV